MESAAFGRCSLGKFAELRGLGPVVHSHAMPRTHIISNEQASPNALAKSTAACPKAMTYRAFQASPRLFP